MQLKKIKVYGSLRKFLKQSYFEAAVNNPKDAIKFLVCNFPEVEKHLTEQIYKIKMNGVQIWQDDLALNGEGDIQIIPVAIGTDLFTLIKGIVTWVGGKAAGVAATVAGAVNVAAGAVYAAGVALAESGFIAGLGTQILYGTAIKGVSDLLTPDTALDPIAGSPADNSDPEDPRAFASTGFNQIVNVSVSGGAVPIIYGEVFTGSVVISASTDVQQVQSA